MRSFILLLLSFSVSYCILIVDLPFDEYNPDSKTILTFDKEIEIRNPFTICISFNLQDYASPRSILGTYDKGLQLIINDVGVGKLEINGMIYIFKVPESAFQPFSWTHLCLSSSNENYHVMGAGKLWYKGKKKLLEPTKIDELLLGSISIPGYYKDVKGKVAELNIFNKSLSLDEMKNYTTCGHFMESTPEKQDEYIQMILNWSTIKTSNIKGRIADNNDTCLWSLTRNPIYKVLPTLLPRDQVMKTCHILKAKLAYPKTLEDYKTWNSKF
jgi:hypothetical protein